MLGDGTYCFGILAMELELMEEGSALELDALQWS